MKKTDRIALRNSLHESDGNWLISYADLMTLLVGFFVLILAFSKPDPEKIERLKKETSSSLGGKYTVPYEEIQKNISSVLQKLDLSEDVILSTTEEGLQVVFKGGYFFDSGSSKLRNDAEYTLTKLAEVLRERAKSFTIQVEGHTDDSPISTREFPSNWELSSARAGTVVRLFESQGLDHHSLRPVGFSDTQPVAPNRDDQSRPIAENQARNRRVVIRILNTSGI